ncbi:-hydroxytryptamine receptor 3A-like isoform X2 [Xyrichtys novacula]|uniref:-hydroxytryptamine receptor 3A-like isoform X2 n=1 Tax=Xyrichtys novacula TaxID=13765 RepID=A0AAV1GPV7_XYRNO|nr:-hydroxytryptamine receptor 3A-like isoform X2 [Xyrichtys novacula]
MVTLTVLTLLSLIGLSSSRAPDCSYTSLLTHLKLTPANDVLQIMRPVKNWTTPTLVQLDMLIYGILHLDEKSQTAESHIWIQMIWMNEFLTWNPSKFCGIGSLAIPRTRVWLPDVTIQEDASDTGSIYVGPHVNLLSNGFVVSTARQRLTSTCEMNLGMFPFDVQNCNITFQSMNSFASEITLGTLNNDTMLYRVSEQFMVTNGEWELEKLEIDETFISKKGMDQARLVYVISMSRKPMLYVINLIVPLLYMLVLDLASFFISDSRGEKLGFKVTILLSISVLLLILQDMLPSTESSMPYIAKYCIAIFAVVGLSVLEAMLVSFLTDFDDYRATLTLRSSSTKEEIEMEDGNNKEPLGTEEEAQVKQEKNVPSLSGPDGLELLRLILQEVKAARKEDEREKAEKKKGGYYKRIAEIIDHVFFVIYFLVVIVFLSYMHIKWIHRLFL